MFTREKLEGMEISKLRFLARISCIITVVKGFSKAVLVCSILFLVAVPSVVAALGFVEEMFGRVLVKKITLEKMTELLIFTVHVSVSIWILGVLMAIALISATSLYEKSSKEKCIEEIMSH